MFNRNIALAIVLIFLSTLSSKAFSKQTLFSVYNIKTPFVLSQPIIAANLIENAADELVAIGVDKKQQTWLAIYVFNDELQHYQLYEKQIIPKKYFAYDLSDFDKENKNKLRTLYFLAETEVAEFKILPLTDEESNKELDKQSNKESARNSFVVKQKVSSMYLVKTADFINTQDFIKDLNQDGIDDIYLPHFEQVNLWLSQCCGQLHAQFIPLDAFVEHDNSRVTFNQRELFFADFNFDNRDDIAWIKQGSIEYFAQTEQGLFSTISQSISLNHEIYGLNWWNIREADGDNLDQSKLAHRMVEQIKDVNGDGLADMVVRFTQSSGVLDRSNDYEFYFGQKNIGKQTDSIDQVPQLSFLQTPSTIIKAEGTLTGLNIVDINNDDKYEVMLSSFELSLTNIIGALISGGIDQDVLLFTLDSENNFEENPFTSKEVELSFSLSNGRSGQPIVQLADINGDGLQDLVLSDDEDTLKVYLGKQGKRRFTRKPFKQDLLLAKDGQNMFHHDINHDGKQDFIMSYSRLDERELLSTFTVLMAN